MWRFVPIASLCLILGGGVRAGALELVFQDIKADSGLISARIALIDSLPDDLHTYIRKGVPVEFNYSIALWKERPGWFDRLQEKHDISLKIRFDPWEKEYTVLESTPELILEQLLDDERDALDLLRRPERSRFAINDTEGVFYVTASLTIKSMTFSSYREVESWLKGEISGAGKPDLEEAPDKLGEFVFDMAVKISGLKNTTLEIRSQKFRHGFSLSAASPDR